MIQIREAKISDSKLLVAFQLKMARETENIVLDRSEVAEGVLAVFRDSMKGTYYVAESDGVVVGSLLTTYEWSDWRNGRILWLQSVYISREYRGRGIFRSMFEHIQKIVRSRSTDFKGIRLYVDKGNRHALEVYQKLGMGNHHYEMFEWMAE